MDTLHIERNFQSYTVIRNVYQAVGSNMYIICEGREAIVVDSNISEELLERLKEKGITKLHLFLTHEHYDHSHGIPWLKENFDTTLYCHQRCRGHLSTKKRSSHRLVAFVLSVKDMNDGGHRYEEFKKSVIDYNLEADVYLEDNQECMVASYIIQAVSTPGHSPGSCLYIMDGNLLFSGDTLIKDNKIITSFRGGDKDCALNITIPKLKALSENLIVLPGHGDIFEKKEYDFNIYK